MVSLVIFLPLFSSICVGFWGYKLGTKGVAVITSFSLGLAVFISFWTFFTIGLKLVPLYIKLLDWIVVGDFFADWVLYIDNLTLLMFILVTIVSSLVYLYVWLVKAK